MSYLDAVLLGLLQGITEFLPISSSGHLVLGEAVLGVKSSGMVFEVALHLATAGAVILAYRKRLRGMLTALPLMFRPRLWKKAAADSTLSPALRENLILDWYILLGTLPAAAAGLLFKDLVESAFSSVRLVCLMLIVTGMILLSSRFARKENHRGLSGRRSLGVGLAQAVALIPGISRSGTTITAGLLLAWRRSGPRNSLSCSPCRRFSALRCWKLSHWDHPHSLRFRAPDRWPPEWRRLFSRGLRRFIYCSGSSRKADSTISPITVWRSVWPAGWPPGHYKLSTCFPLDYPPKYFPRHDLTFTLP